jgi:hypothetical protein
MTAPDDGGLPPYPPGWCGKDLWSVDPDAVIGSPANYAPALAAPAYVNNYQLVLKNDRGYFQVPFGDTTIELYSPIVSARIVPLGADGNPRDASAPPAGLNDGNFALEDAVIAGRVPASSMLAVAGSLVAPGAKDGGAQFLCQSLVFPSLRDTLCGARDIASSAQVDFDPKAICDSISTTTSFRARPAAAGDKYRPADLFNACVISGDDAGTLAEEYRCRDDAGP